MPRSVCAGQEQLLVLDVKLVNVILTYTRLSMWDCHVSAFYCSITNQGRSLLGQ